MTINDVVFIRGRAIDEATIGARFSGLDKSEPSAGDGISSAVVR